MTDLLQKPEPQSFAARHLDPASRLGEVLFGLIMVLTMTLTAEVALGGHADAREMLVATIGCNIAWGLIDAIMYLMNCMVARSERVRLVKAVQATPDAETGLAVVRERLGEEFDTLTMPENRETLYQSIYQRLTQSAPVKVRLSKKDWLGAVACFWLVFLACLPAAFPFLVFAEPVRALRVSNALLLVMLFLVGWKWAAFTGSNRWAAGLAMLMVGLALVGVAILLGG